MKQIMLVFLVAFSIVISSCNGKKEDQNFGKPAAAETKPDNSAFPLAEKGAEIFAGKGTCATCHKLDVKSVGPSIQDIAKIYNDKKANMATFLKGEAEPIVDPTQFEVMKANFALTKTFTDEELQSLEQYFYSQIK